MWAEFAPAKINLTLGLTGKREDGYHTLESMIAFASCGDRVSAETSDKTSLTISGPFAADIAGTPEDNLVLRALRAAEAACGRPLNMHVTLEKNLPVASGIGGGSADAAAMLRMIRRVFGKQMMDSTSFEKIASSLGADVPVCLESQNAFVSGIGEIIHPMKHVAHYGILLVNPLKALPTKDVFQAFKGEFAAASKGAEEAQKTSLLKYILARKNMLEDAAISKMPEIAGLLATIGATPNCLLARMSGSGATCFGLYETKLQAEIAAIALSKAFPSYWVAPAQLIT